jgi:hypothetical protein
VVTAFAIAAPGWSDDNLPLEYRFGVETEAAVTHLNDFGANSDVTAFLPAGQPEQDYMLRVVVEAADSLGARATATIDARFGAPYLPYPAVLDIHGLPFHGF